MIRASAVPGKWREAIGEWEKTFPLPLASGLKPVTTRGRNRG